jgi:hypothetical protein
MSMRTMALVLAVLPCLPLSTPAAPPKTEVFVLGTLYKRHETTKAYDLYALRRIVVAIKPDVFVLDCTPREVQTQTVHASKIEYPGVIFPVINEGKPEGKYAVYPAEPDEPMFTEIVQVVSAAHTAFEKNSPEQSAALKAYVTATYAALALSWQSAADTQDETTAAVLAGKKALEHRFIGKVSEEGQYRWDRHWTDRILDAVAKHPGARILAVTGIENRPWIVDALRRDPRVTVVDMPAWIRDHAGKS